MKGIIAIDIGTTSMRAILYDERGRILHKDQRDNLPEYFSDGRVEQNPSAWRTILPAVLSSCASALSSLGLEAVCLSVTAQRSSVIPVDREGTPLYPAIMWQDNRTASLAQELSGQNSLVYQKTGLKVSPVFSALKMTWLRRNQPDVWKRTSKFLGIQDWVLYLLTGRFVTDQSFASRTNLFDLSSLAWDDQLLELFEVERRMLCEVVPPGAVVGGLRSEMARASGLPQGLPVVSAGGDQQCAALGLGLFTGDRAVCNTGTGSYLIGHSAKPALDPQMRLACNVSAVPGAYIVEAAVLTSGTLYRWFRETLAVSTPDTTGWETLNAEAAAAVPGANGLLLLPHFKGAGAPHWDTGSKGVFFNLTLSTTRGEMARAILEGIALEMQASLELIEALCGRVHSVSVSGGMTRSELYNQIQADVFERPIVRYQSDEATSLGAWIAGAVALGLEPSYLEAFTRATEGSMVSTSYPLAENKSVYEQNRAQVRALYTALASPEFRAAFG